MVLRVEAKSFCMKIPQGKKKKKKNIAESSKVRDNGY